MVIAARRERSLGPELVRSEAQDERDDVKLAARGDRAAFGRLYERHAPDVSAFLHALRLGLDAHTVEDAVQESFLRVYRLLRGQGGAYDEGRPLRPYLLGIARHVALDLARRPRPSPFVDPAGGAGGQAERQEERELVARALAALEPEYRAALVLRHLSGLGMQDLSDALGCSIPTARARLEAAGHLFAQELKRRGVDPKGATS